MFGLFAPKISKAEHDRIVSGILRDKTALDKLADTFRQQRDETHANERAAKLRGSK